MQDTGRGRVNQVIQFLVSPTLYFRVKPKCYSKSGIGLLFTQNNKTLPFPKLQNTDQWLTVPKTHKE